MKRYIGENKAPFRVNVERDAGAARDIVRRTGQTGVPVIKIGGAWIVGFDKARVEGELGRRASEDLRRCNGRTLPYTSPYEVDRRREAVRRAGHSERPGPAP